MGYILACLFVIALAFAYLQAKLFVGTIQYLVKIISELKSFSMGQPSPGIPVKYIKPPSHPDFGLGDIVNDIEKAEREADEKLI
jgi:hypothetical protein